MGYYLTSTKDMQKVINRIKEVGIKAYEYYNCIPTKIITVNEDMDEFSKGTVMIYYDNRNEEDINPLRFLGFGFEGLYEDEEKVEEIESFGKYRCVIYYDNEINLTDKKVTIEEFVF